MRWAAYALAMWLGIAIPGLAFGDASLADIERARAKVLTPSYQPTLPQDERAMGQAGVHDGTPRDRVARDRARRIDTRDARSNRSEHEVSGLVSILMWGFIAIGLVLVGAWIGNELMKGEDDARIADDDDRERAAAAATAAIIDRPLGDADELATRGLYAEAIHTLLLRTLHELARSAMVRVERSHTSREILARVPLLADARDALAGLITAVELTHFGDEPATAADYARCRDQFNRFAEVFRAGLASARPAPHAEPA
jgi:hypothetical protein